MKYWIFTIQSFFKKKKELKIVKSNHNQLKKIIELKASTLKKNNVKYLALDFDGVLAAHGNNVLNSNVYQWLTNFTKYFSQNNIFILSNNPNRSRENYFKKHFPNINFINNVKRKPYPEGLFYIQQVTQCKPKELALVDDRILTGCLACILSGSVPILLTDPYKNYKKNPIQECFFTFLRSIEKILF